MFSKGSIFFLLLGRFSGFFLFSPFFASRLGFLIRFCIGLACTLALLPTTLQTNTTTSLHPISFILLLTKEILVGYLLGFLFSLLWEAAAFAGDVISTLGGFSVTTLFNSPSNENHSLFSSFFSLTILILFFALDLHHFILRLINESLSFLPLGTFVLSENTVFNILNGFGKLFYYAMNYAFFPFMILICCNVILAFFARDLMIFLNGFPLQIFITLSLIALFLFSFDKILLENFAEIFSLAKKAFFPL